MHRNQEFYLSIAVQSYGESMASGKKSEKVPVNFHLFFFRAIFRAVFRLFLGFERRRPISDKAMFHQQDVQHEISDLPMAVIIH